MKLTLRLAAASGAAALFAAGAACAQTESVPQDVTVEAPAGAVRGIARDEVEIFMGIPFAAPPTGSARWAPPSPAPSWDGALDATRFGPACMQPSPQVRSIYTDTPPAMSEDCLNLNIWAPADAEAAPVFVWIHGGSLTRGANSQSMYDGASFAQRGIVFVSINYRLGVLGYMAHPELSAESSDGVSGNYGLLDQIAALEWIERNIAAFGGDPENVTIAGESAGALSVTYLMASPRARGLFDKAVAQSAYTLSTPALRTARFGAPPAEAVGVYVAGELGASGVSELRAMEAENVVEAAARTRFIPWGTIDGVVLPDQLVNIFDRGEQAPVPLLAGFNEGEIRSLRFLLPPAPEAAGAYERTIRERYADLADEMLDRYSPRDIEESMLATTRDAMYGWTAERLVRKQSQTGEPGYLYYFDHSYRAADRLGLHAFHASEIPYVLDTLDHLSPHWPAPPDTPAEQALADAMIGYWTAFARTGDPDVADLPDWPAYGGSEAYMYFDGGPQGGHRDLLPGMFELHEEVMCRRRAADVGWHWNVGVAAPPLPAQTEGCR